MNSLDKGRVPNSSEAMKAFSLAGRVALISGGARGIGAEIALAFASAGANVMVTDINEEQGRQTVEKIASFGGVAEFMRLDAADEANWESVLATTLQRFGGLDVLVNNAGIELFQFLTDTRVEDFRRILDVNVTGVFLGCKHAMRAMRPGGAAGNGGSIINLSSIGGLVGFTGLGAYVASKGAVRLLTKSVAVECGQLGLGIRCNSIHPGLVKTEMGQQVLQQYVDFKLVPDLDSAKSEFVAAHPIGFLGEPVDIALAALYLASDAARWVTGAELAVDGGFTAI
jgi:NAD(P)-dependent dehydrogenase (short-subunit alcohol dehydrogenase family)